MSDDEMPLDGNLYYIIDEPRLVIPSPVQMGSPQRSQLTFTSFPINSDHTVPWPTVRPINTPVAVHIYSHL